MGKQGQREAGETGGGGGGGGLGFYFTSKSLKKDSLQSGAQGITLATWLPQQPCY